MAASMTSTPAKAKTRPRAMVPITPSSSTTGGVRGLICDVLQVLHECAANALADQYQADDDDDQADDADQPPAWRRAAWPWPSCPAADGIDCAAYRRSP